MKTSKHPETHPGTSTIKSRHNAFNWRHPRNVREDHALTSEYAASFPLDTTTAFRNWLVAIRTCPKSAKTWPEFLAAYKKPSSRRDHKAKKILRDNTVSPFGVAIPNQQDADKQRRIKASNSGARA